ncbi:MAG: tetratricopeptide repeat protein [Chloroflexia bacterium]|nr:tetratricopeptide repeat protein [Chloroflexia bacterium]
MSTPSSTSIPGPQPAAGESHPLGTRAVGEDQVEGGVPTALAPMVGRRRERIAVSDVLRNPEVRLLVLTGPGGVGKTRLALSVVDGLRDSFRDGVWFVDLSPISRSDLVLPTIAGSLGVRHSSNVPLMDAINATIRSRQMLLMVDNFEHVADAALLLTDLLMANPDLTILVTSRSVLSVYGEHVYPVPPMSVPLVPDDAPAGTPLTRSLLTSDAVQLFVRRASAVRGDFHLTNENARDVASICRLLDGLPLAIELAAARIGILSPRMLVQRLQRRLPLLDDGPRDVPDRLRTMRNAISWSYDLLEPDEQAVFRRIAIFANTWTLSDAVRVVADPDQDGPADEFEILDLISSLVDKSLIRQVDSDTESPHFAMLQVLREFGLEQLDLCAERLVLERRHALYMFDIAEAAGPELIGPNQVVWLERLAAMHPDLQTAFAWSMEHDPPELALGLATGLWRFGYTRGHIREGREWIETALRRAPARTSLRGTALNGAGILANMERDLDDARILHSEALSIATEIDDKRLTGVAHIGLGDCAATRHDFDEATYHYDQAERIFRTLGDQRNIAAVMTNVGNLLWSQDKLAEAVDTNERARILYTNAGDRRGIAWSATNIGRIAAQQQDYARAVPNLEQALQYYDQLGDRGGYAEALEGIAQVAVGMGDFARAASLLAAADGLREAVNHPISPIDRDAYTTMIDILRQELGKAFDSIWETDRALGFDEVKALSNEILNDDPAPTNASPRLARQAAINTLIKELGISEREIEVLTLVAAGKTDKDIADELFIGVRTVQSHVANLLTKLEVSARSAAVARALRAGIIT